jgi:hypothetical protein
MTLYRRWIAAGLTALATLATAGVAAARTPDVKLLHRYEPVTRFDAQEHFFPTMVQSFIDDSTLEVLGPTGWTTVDPDPGPGNLPAAGSGPVRLNEQPCSPASTLGGLDCYVAAWQDDPGGPAVYGHVVRESNKIVLQYWYFYYDDVYSYDLYSSLGLGPQFIWQAHEGDWEVVNVVLSASEEPESVGYSQHCLGQTRGWAATPVAGGTHPIVYVAAGSHANYPSAGAHTFDIACIPPQALQLLIGANLPLPVDYAFGTGLVAGPPGTDGTVTPVHVISDDVPAWVSFPGYWGEAEYFHAAPLPVPTFPSGGFGPEGPAGHPVWSDPLATLATWPPG